MATKKETKTFFFGFDVNSSGEIEDYDTGDCLKTLGPYNYIIDITIPISKEGSFVKVNFTK